MMRFIKARSFISRYGIYLAFLILCAVIAVMSPPFLRSGNLLNILRQTSINGIVAVGMTFVIITGGIDLSVGSMVALAAVLAASFAHTGQYPLVVPILAGLMAGGLCGLTNGVLIAKRRLAPFIVTLGMMTAARGLALVYTDGRPVIDLSKEYTNIGGGYLLGIPVPVLIFLLIVVAGMFILKFTKFGRQVYATGSNEQAARISGVQTKQKIIAVYVIAGLLSGLTGIILSSRIMAGSPVAGTGYELDAIAAVVIGGTSLKGGVGSITGTVTGVLIIGVMNNGLDLMGVSSYWQQIVKAGIIIMAALLDRKSHSE